MITLVLALKKGLELKNQLKINGLGALGGLVAVQLRIRILLGAVRVSSCGSSMIIGPEGMEDTMMTCTHSK